MEKVVWSKLCSVAAVPVPVTLSSLLLLHSYAASRFVPQHYFGLTSPPPCGFVFVTQGGTLTSTKGRENINVCHAPKRALPAKELRSTKQVTHKTPQRDCPWSCWLPLGVSLMLAHASCSSHTHGAQCGQCACVSHLCFVAASVCVVAHPQRRTAHVSCICEWQRQ